MNGPFVIRQAEALADRVRALRTTTPIALIGRIGSPSRGRRLPAERDRALAFLREFAARAGGSDPARGAWSAFCQALLAGAEFRYRD